MDWVYKQIIGFLANFFAEMGNMGAEMFEMSWMQSIVLFFSYLAWILYAVGFVVACAECGLEYSSGRADIKGTAMNLNGISLEQGEPLILLVHMVTEIIGCSHMIAQPKWPMIILKWVTKMFRFGIWTPTRSLPTIRPMLAHCPMQLSTFGARTTSASLQEPRMERRQITQIM